MITRSTFARLDEQTAPEDGGGGAGSSTTPAASPEQPAKPVEPAKTEPAKLTPEQLRAKLASSRKQTQDEIEALRAEVQSLKTATEAEKAAIKAEFDRLKAEKLDLAFERAKIKPEYREFAKTKLGELDLSKADDLAKIDEFARNHAAFTAASPVAQDPQSAWVDQVKGAKPEAGKVSLASMMPREVLAQLGRRS